MYPAERDQLDAQARTDLPTLTDREHHLKPVNCTRCATRVYTYASSADGQRHYCRCIAWLPSA